MCCKGSPRHEDRHLTSSKGQAGEGQGKGLAATSWCTEQPSPLGNWCGVSLQVLVAVGEEGRGVKDRTPVGETRDGNMLTTAHSHQPYGCSQFPEWDVRSPAAARAKTKNIVIDKAVSCFIDFQKQKGLIKPELLKCQAQSSGWHLLIFFALWITLSRF